MNDVLVKKGKWFIAVIFTATIFSTVSAYARTMELRPICNIEGIIKSVKFKDHFFNADPSIYLLGININSVSSGGNETGFYTCKSFYTIGEVREVFIVESDIKAGDIFSVGQKINGVIDDVGYRAGSLDGMRLVSYTLRTVSQPQPIKLTATPVKENIVTAIKSSSEISVILVEQKQLNVVNDIELSSDEQQYTARGYRSAKLLFFIPVSVKVELKINAMNGSIEQVKKSWWAFLVRY